MGHSDDVEQVLEAARYDGSGASLEEIVGLAHARREVAAITSLLKQRDLAREMGAELTPLLFVGPAGVGKTLLARAMSRDLDLPMYVWSASELSAPLIGQIFRALANVPCLIFIDEIDLIGVRRHSDVHSAGTKAALVQLCTAMDGIHALNGPLVVAATATNSLFLDESLTRSGRFSTKIEFEPPDRAERRQLFALYTSRIVATEPLDLDEAAERSQGVTGADIRAVINSGLALALADGHRGLTQQHLFEALERRGHVRKQAVLDPSQAWQAAVHETGHAFAAFALFGAHALNRVSIIPRHAGRELAAGHFEFDEQWQEDNPTSTANWRQVAMVGYGGAVAEELLLGFRREGCSSDAYRATDLIVSQILAGSDPDFGPVSAARVESGGPYGSEAMRSRLWHLVDRHSHELLARTRGLLAPLQMAMDSFALVLSAEQTLSGEHFVEALRAAGAAEAPVHLPA